MEEKSGGRKSSLDGSTVDGAVEVAGNGRRQRQKYKSDDGDDGDGALNIAHHVLQFFGAALRIGVANIRLLLNSVVSRTIDSAAFEGIFEAFYDLLCLFVITLNILVEGFLEFFTDLSRVRVSRTTTATTKAQTMSIAMKNVPSRHLLSFQAPKHPIPAMSRMTLPMMTIKTAALWISPAEKPEPSGS